MPRKRCLLSVCSCTRMLCVHACVGMHMYAVCACTCTLCVHLGNICSANARLHAFARMRWQCFCMHTYACTFACARARLQCTCTSCVHAHVRCVCMRTYAVCAHLGNNCSARARLHTFTLARLHVRVGNASACTHMHARLHVHVHACNASACTPTLARLHVHLHTYTRVLAYALPPSWSYTVSLDQALVRPWVFQIG